MYFEILYLSCEKSFERNRLIARMCYLSYDQINSNSHWKRNQHQTYLHYQNICLIMSLNNGHENLGTYSFSQFYLKIQTKMKQYRYKWTHILLFVMQLSQFNFMNKKYVFWCDGINSVCNDGDVVKLTSRTLITNRQKK